MNNFKKIAFNHKADKSDKLLKVNFNSYDYSNSLVYKKNLLKDNIFCT